MFCLCHTVNNNAFIKKVVAHPRLCEWTEDINDAQEFEFERESKAAADFIKQLAFSVESFVKPEQ